MRSILRVLLQASFIEVRDGLEPERIHARIWFEQPIPMTFHGIWAPADG
jgi:carotenoid cleavage dioxygenase-like enzyme